MLLGIFFLLVFVRALFYNRRADFVTLFTAAIGAVFFVGGLITLTI
jgi:hypothetical protein